MSGIRELPDDDATRAWGVELAKALRPGDVILLRGPLGAGKTTLVRGLVEALGGDPAEVCSPTFVLLETYGVDAAPIRRVHHADLYRLEGQGDAPWHEIGLGEALDDPDAVTAIEWPERLRWSRPAGCRVLFVSLDHHGEGRRARFEWA